MQETTAWPASQPESSAAVSRSGYGRHDAVGRHCSWQWAIGCVLMSSCCLVAAVLKAAAGGVATCSEAVDVTMGEWANGRVLKEGSSNNVAMASPCGYREVDLATNARTVDTMR